MNKVKQIIGKIKKPVDKAVGKVVGWVVKTGKKLWARVKGVFGKKEKPSQTVLDPKTQKAVAEGIQDSKKEQKKYVNEKGEITHEDAEKVAKNIKHRHSVFNSVKVIDAGETYNFRFKVNPEFEYVGPKKHQLSVEQLYKKYAYKGSAVNWYKGIYPGRTLLNCMSGGFIASSTANRTLSPSNRITDTGWHYGSTDNKVAWSSKFTSSHKGIVFKLKNTKKCVDVYKNYTGYASGNSPEKGELARWYQIPGGDIVEVQFFIGNRLVSLSANEYGKIPNRYKNVISNLIFSYGLIERGEKLFSLYNHDQEKGIKEASWLTIFIKDKIAKE